MLLKKHAYEHVAKTDTPAVQREEGTQRSESGGECDNGGGDSRGHMDRNDGSCAKIIPLRVKALRAPGEDQKVLEFTPVAVRRDT